MNAVTSPAKPFTQWLDELVAAASDDRRLIAIAGLDAGVGFERVRCDRHRVTLNWQSAFAHLDRTEASWRLHHGAGAREHEVGDLRPLRAGEAGAQPPTTWPIARCKSQRCSTPIVWARTATGSRMPVDAWPNTAGSVLLVDSGDDEATAAGSRGALPLAVVVRDEIRATLRPEELDKLHETHFATCRYSAEWRRS